MGLRASIAASAQIPTADSKVKWLSQIARTEPSSNSQSLPFAKLREAMANYQLLGQEESSRHLWTPISRLCLK